MIIERIAKNVVNDNKPKYPAATTHPETFTGNTYFTPELSGRVLTISLGIISIG